MDAFLNTLPAAPARVFFVGIGGIGMSGLAQLLRWQGFEVAGSDRGLTDAGKEELYESLRRQGISLFPQDGSGVRHFAPACLVVSTAVEEDNPDLKAAKDVPVIHRARALSQALARVPGSRCIAVAGSCGKTSVTGWIAAALRALGEPVLVVNGGYLNGLPTEPGNFHADEAPRWVVAEVDESDKSISEFSPEYGVLLNVGDDHYEREELRRVFREFLGRCRLGSVVNRELAELHDGIREIPMETFDDGGVMQYRTTRDGMAFEEKSWGRVACSQCGRHSVWNAMAVLTLLRMLFPQRDAAELREAVAAFAGVRQRFEKMGERMRDGVPFINDYAHNPEKISAAISAARERFGSPLYLVLQPHGFRPLAFMRESLKEQLLKVLQSGDRLRLLPVFYAGGTAAFRPTSAEVADEFASAGLPVRAAERIQVAAELRKVMPAAVVVMGGRDASLRPWTRELCVESGSLASSSGMKDLNLKNASTVDGIRER